MDAKLKIAVACDVGGFPLQVTVKEYLSNRKDIIVSNLYRSR